MAAYISLNRLDEARATIQEAQAHRLEFANLHLGLYHIAFLQGDTAGMEHEAAYLRNKPELQAHLPCVESETAAFYGKFSQARELAVHAVDAANTKGWKDPAAAYQVQAGLREAIVGNSQLAKQQAETATKLSDNKYVEAVSALVLALVGDPAKAERLADALARRYPENTSLQFQLLPMVHGTSALQKHDTAKALQVFAAGAPYELGHPMWMNFVTLYSVYLRGCAYLAVHQGAEAATQFQKILDNRSLVLTEPTGALAHLGLGRAYAIIGDKSKAQTAYQDFFSLWKDADAEIPILKQAKAEYVKLQ